MEVFELKFVVYYIYSMVITGLVFVLRLLFTAFFGLFMTNPGILSTILAILVTMGLAIWYIDWNMRR